MRILIVEIVEISRQTRQTDLFCDIFIPYIKGFLKSRGIRYFSAKLSTSKKLKEIIKAHKPTMVIVGGSTEGFPKDVRWLSPVEYLNLLKKNAGKDLNLFYYNPCFQFEYYETGRLKTIPHIVLSNSCNYSRSIRTNKLYKNVSLPKNVKVRGCTFCLDTDSDIRWKIKDDTMIKNSILSALNVFKGEGDNSIRVMGEEFTSKPFLIFSILRHLNIKNINVIVSIRPELLIEHFDDYSKSLEIASHDGNSLTICTIGIESFYESDLLRFNRQLGSVGLLRAIENLYLLKERFSENLILDKYNLFNFILFTPYTTLDSLRYNLKIMNAIGIMRIPASCLLNRLSISDRMPLYHLIKKDNLLTADGGWSFADKDVSDLYSRLTLAGKSDFDIAELVSMVGG